MNCEAWFLFRSSLNRLVPTLRVGMHTRTLRVRVPPMHGRAETRINPEIYDRIVGHFC